MLLADHVPSPSQLPLPPATIHYEALHVDDAKKFQSAIDEFAVSSPDTAAVFTAQLGVHCRPASLQRKLERGETFLVGQPMGSKIKWLFVTIT